MHIVAPSGIPGKCVILHKGQNSKKARSVCTKLNELPNKYRKSHILTCPAHAYIHIFGATSYHPTSNNSLIPSHWGSGKYDGDLTISFSIQRQRFSQALFHTPPWHGELATTFDDVGARSNTTV